MNDFERKLRDTPLRQPPAALRAEILAALPANQPAALNWREWLWPPPPAWIALAAVWLVLFSIESIANRTPVKSTAIGAGKTPSPESLFAFRNEQVLALTR